MSEPMVDIREPEHGVQVQIRSDRRVLWVHVDGVTVLRISAIPELDVEVMGAMDAGVDAEEPPK